MRNAHVTLALVALAAYGCDDAGQQPLTAPSTVSAIATPLSGESRLSPPSQRDVQPDAGTLIALGQAISSRVTDDDPICGSAYPFPCRYFRVAVPQDGVLEITIRWSAALRDPYPLDMDVIGPSGVGWIGEIAEGPRRIARGRVAGGNTYVIEVWSFLTPHEPFELTTSLERRP